MPAGRWWPRPGAIASVFIPLPRNVGNVEATIRTAPGRRRQKPTSAVSLTPANAAKDAIFFGITSWQGGGTRAGRPDRDLSGRLLERAAVPILGKWKSMISLLRGSQNMGGPDLPAADPFITHRRSRRSRTDRGLRAQHQDAAAGAARGPAWRRIWLCRLGPFHAIFIGLMVLTTTNLDADESQEGAVPPLGQRPPGTRHGQPNGSCDRDAGCGRSVPGIRGHERS